MVPALQRRCFLTFVPAVLLGAVACGSSIRTQTVSVRPVAASTTSHSKPAAETAPAKQAPPPAPVPAPDPVAALIASSELHFTAGERELQLGHFDGARQEFNRAIDVLLESPFGARTDARVREHFDRLVDRISAYEVKALAEGDGFTEKKYEPASIDELLAVSATFGPPPSPSPELHDAVKTDIATAGHDIPIPLNNRVLAYVELFQGRLHDFIQDGLTRGSRYLPMIQNVFRAEGLPLDLAYVPLIESAFKPNALSRTKAKGVWQFMSGTAVENGLRRDWYIDERSDPEKATEAAARYLKTLNTMFHGNWHLALASYNGGPGRLQKAIKRIGIDDFWKLAESPRVLPRETREYVPMILAAIVIARNPAQYGFEFDAAPPVAAAPAYEKIALDRPVDLRRIAEWADTTIGEIQSLNPELRRWTTPVKDTSYELKVPAGSADQVRARLADATAADLAPLKWYTVKRGDTLPVIARRLNVSRTDLAEANYLSRNARVTVGQKLAVPHETTVLMAASSNRTAPPAEARVVAAGPSTMPEPGASGRIKLTYEVQHGDTLASIARLFRTSVSALRTWNRSLGARITPGERLTVYKPMK